MKIHPVLISCLIVLAILIFAGVVFFVPFNCGQCSGAGITACSSCSGTGLTTCGSCMGNTVVSCSDCDGAGYENHSVRCDLCNGTGTIPGSGCAVCGGKGRLTFSIPYFNERTAKFEYPICTLCNGSGKRTEDSECHCYFGTTVEQVDCSACSATGIVDCGLCSKTGTMHCSRCSGSATERCKQCAGTGKRKLYE